MASAIFYIIFFYNSKISTPNELISLLEKDDFNLKKKLSLKKTDFQGPYKLLIS